VKPRPSNEALARRSRGIALIAVLWVVLLLAVIAGSLTMLTRTEIGLSRNLVLSAKAEALAEGGVYLAIGELLTPASSPQDGNRKWQVETDAGHLDISYVDVTGRIDLNIAPPELIAGLSGSRPISRTWADLESAARLVLPELCLGFSRRFPWLVSKIGPGDRRLADLARHAMALNHNHLAKEYGQNNVNDLWNSFRRLLAEAAAEERYELIGRETRLFP